MADERGAELAVERRLKVSALDRHLTVTDLGEQLPARRAPDVSFVVRHRARRCQRARRLWSPGSRFLVAFSGDKSATRRHLGPSKPPRRGRANRLSPILATVAQSGRCIADSGDDRPAVAARSLPRSGGCVDQDAASFRASTTIVTGPGAFRRRLFPATLSTRWSTSLRGTVLLRAYRNGARSL